MAQSPVIRRQAARATLQLLSRIAFFIPSAEDFDARILERDLHRFPLMDLQRQHAAGFRQSLVFIDKVGSDVPVEDLYAMVAAADHHVVIPFAGEFQRLLDLALWLGLTEVFFSDVVAVTGVI